MRCPKCSHQEDKVIDSRGANNGAVIRRRRMCLGCGYRYTTYEEIVKTKLRVVKRDGRSEDLDRGKLTSGIERACEKRPIGAEVIEKIVDGVIEELESEHEREISSSIIGKKVMDKLEKLDEVAFVRFASVYRRFKDANQFLRAVEGLIGKGMIWAPDNNPEESAVVSHLTAAIDGVCGSVLSANASTIQELAKAVELYLGQNGYDSYVDSQHLMMLASKALDSIGEGQAARRMLLFGTGLLKPSEWEITGGDTMWVLDLRQLTVREDAPIELVFFSSLSMILDSVSDVWDESQGKGVLGLRHVCSAVCDLTGGGSPKKRKAMTAEIKGICGKKLEQLKISRSWGEVPAVIDLDV